jgi:phage recombination protein Bet
MTTAVSTIDNNVLIKFLDSMGLAKDLTEAEKNQYIGICQAFGLNPFKREVHVSKYGNEMSILTGYEVYLKRAERTGQLNGWSCTTDGTVEGGDLKATCTIYRKDREHPFVWDAYYSESVQKTKEGKPNRFWSTRPLLMTKKVAISQAFRLCFSDELGGMPYTQDEIQVDAEVVSSKPLPVEPSEPIKQMNEVQAGKIGMLMQSAAYSEEDRKTIAKKVQAGMSYDAAEKMIANMTRFVAKHQADATA